MKPSIDFYGSIKQEVFRAGNYQNNKGLVLDNITPLVKSFMQTLSPVEQAIIYALIVRKTLIRKNLTTNNMSEYLTMNLLSREVRKDSKSLSVCAGRMFKAGLIDRRPVNNKDFEYGISNQYLWDWFKMRYDSKNSLFK